MDEEKKYNYCRGGDNFMCVSHCLLRLNNARSGFLNRPNATSVHRVILYFNRVYLNLKKNCRSISSKHINDYYV